VTVDPGATVHPTADVEDGVSVGAGTAVWDHVHVRGPGTTIGVDCIVGEKTYVAYGVAIGDRVKLNASVYVPTGITIEDGVMVGAHTTFTNDRFPRATTADLSLLRSSDVDEDTERTLVREGATLGAAVVVGPGVRIGRFAMVGAGATVTRSVGDFVLVAGSPARTIGAVCRCGPPFLRVAPGDPLPDGGHACAGCGRRYHVEDGVVTEVSG
jgi:UDP-2-acetamido-3-amino-2,3-dideoxy-glucuronate N-acetyltransferase